MPGIPEETLERIRMSADIVDVVSSYVPMLKRNGRAYKACCPFHEEKTPSFTVNPERQIYKCFGCGKGGNAFTFVMEMEHLDFPNAAKLLAGKYGIPIPEDEPAYRRRPGGTAQSYPKANTGAEEDYNIRERLYQLHEQLAAWYNSLLHNGAVKQVSAYYATRGIPVDFTNQFMLGAAPDTWDSALNFAHSHGFTDRELVLSGIVSEKDEHSTHIYDRFRNRLMFPIWNEQGRIVAFSARSVEKDPGGWKYVNSPETPVFKKSRTLYALHIARKKIAEAGFAILCEGQIDVIAMHRAQCSNAVAAQGTAFTPEHAMILKRYTQSVCLALDNDKAGRAAVFKDAEILLPLGFSLKVAQYKGAKDADELLSSQGGGAVRETVASAVDFFDFAFEHACTEHDSATPGGKSEIALKMISHIILMENPVTREFYLRNIADKLGVSFDSLKLELDREDLKRKNLERSRKIRADLREAVREGEGLPSSAQSASPVPAKARPLSESVRPLRKAYTELLEVILADEELASRAGGDLTSEFLDESPEGTAIECVIQSKMNEEWDTASESVSFELTRRGMDVSEISSLLIRTPVSESEVPPDDDERKKLLRRRKKLRARIYEDCVKIIVREFTIFERSKLMDYAKTIPDGAEKLEIMRKIVECSQKIMKLK